METYNPRIIQHGVTDGSWHCRQCRFSGVAVCGSALQKAKTHSNNTGHTVDVYYETWREITCYKKRNK